VLHGVQMVLDLLLQREDGAARAWLELVAQVAQYMHGRRRPQRTP